MPTIEALAQRIVDRSDGRFTADDYHFLSEDTLRTRITPETREDLARIIGWIVSEQGKYDRRLIRLLRRKYSSVCESLDAGDDQPVLQGVPNPRYATSEGYEIAKREGCELELKRWELLLKMQVALGAELIRVCTPNALEEGK